MTDRDLTLGEAEAYRRAQRDAAAVCADRSADAALQRLTASSEAAACAAAILALEPRAGGEVVHLTREDQRMFGEALRRSVKVVDDGSAARIAELEAEVARLSGLVPSVESTLRYMTEDYSEGYAAGAAAMREAAAAWHDNCAQVQSGFCAAARRMRTKVEHSVEASRHRWYAQDIRALPLPDAAQAPKEGE